MKPPPRMPQVAGKTPPPHLKCRRIASNSCFPESIQIHCFLGPFWCHFGPFPNSVPVMSENRRGKNRKKQKQKKLSDKHLVDPESNTGPATHLPSFTAHKIGILTALLISSESLFIMQSSLALSTLLCKKILFSLLLLQFIGRFSTLQFPKQCAVKVKTIKNHIKQ